MTKRLVGATEASNALNKYFPEVTWDRFVSEDTEPNEENLIYTLYGWVDRDDSYKDFVIVQFYWDGDFTYYTSSAKYSAVWHERIHGTSEGHSDCKRIEDWFPGIKNVVRLSR